jgi:hypothetical protein
MSGHVQKRGRSSWRLKYDIGVGADGQKRSVYRTVKGTRFL